MFDRCNIFRFSCRWTVQRSREDAFDYVSDPRTFGEWFPVFKQVQTYSVSGGISPGARATCQVRAALPYRIAWDISVTDVQRDTLTTHCRLKLAGYAMSGMVRYTFGQLGSAVVIDNEQALVCERPIPRLFHALLQRLFAWNHAWAMRRGEAGLRRMLRRRGGPNRTD